MVYEAVAALLLLATPSEVQDADQDYLVFSRWLEDSINQKDPDAIDRAFDLDALIARTLKDAPIPEGARNECRADLRRRFSFASGITDALGAPRSGYKLLRVRTTDGQTKAICRMIGKSGGANYHEWLLGRSPDGKGVKIQDVYIYLAGEYLSQIYRRSILIMFAQRGGATADDAGQIDKEYLKHLSKAGVFRKLLLEQRAAEALELYQSLPEALKRDRYFLLFRFQAARLLGAEELTKALAEFRKHYPKDAALDFLSVDALAAQGFTNEAVAALERLEAQLGGDAFCQTLRGRILLNAGKLDPARDAAERAVKAEPTLPEAYLLRASISLVEKNYAATIAALSEIEKVSGQRPDITEMEGYADFLKSEEYLAWRKAAADAREKEAETKLAQFSTKIEKSKEDKTLLRNAREYLQECDRLLDSYGTTSVGRKLRDLRGLLSAAVPDSGTTWQADYNRNKGRIYTQFVDTGNFSGAILQWKEFGEVSKDPLFQSRVDQEILVIQAKAKDEAEKLVERVAGLDRTAARKTLEEAADRFAGTEGERLIKDRLRALK